MMINPEDIYFECEYCGDNYNPDFSEALEQYRYCSPECEGDDNDYDEYYEE